MRDAVSDALSDRVLLECLPCALRQRRLSGHARVVQNRWMRVQASSISASDVA